jgi:Amt family ammonium transporter
MLPISIDKARGCVDGTLDVFDVHDVEGILGALLTGVFATRAVNPADAATAGLDRTLHGEAAHTFERTPT